MQTHSIGDSIARFFRDGYPLPSGTGALQRARDNAAQRQAAAAPASFAETAAAAPASFAETAAAAPVSFAETAAAAPVSFAETAAATGHERADARVRVAHEGRESRVDGREGHGHHHDDDHGPDRLVPGVMKLLRDDHFTNVAEVRIRIIFADEVAAIEAEREAADASMDVQAAAPVASSLADVVDREVAQLAGLDDALQEALSAATASFRESAMSQIEALTANGPVARDDLASALSQEIGALMDALTPLLPDANLTTLQEALVSVLDELLLDEDDHDDGPAFAQLVTRYQEQSGDVAAAAPSLDEQA